MSGADTISGLKVGNHQFRAFTGLDAAFGADGSDYPVYASIPEEFKRSSNPFHQAAGSLFFKGGKLEDYGLRLKPDVDAGLFFTTIRALLCSFAPPHQQKQATVGWLLSEHTEAIGEAKP